MSDNCTVKLDLPFKLPPKDLWPFLCTLEKKYQESIWISDYESYRKTVEEAFDENLQRINDYLKEAVVDRDSGSDAILNYIDFDYESDESYINEFTGERVVTKDTKVIVAARKEALEVINRLIDACTAILKDPRNLLVDFLWESQIVEIHSDYSEGLLLKHLEELPEYQELFDRFHLFYGRDPENERIRAAHLAKWDEAQELAKNGDASKLEELKKLSPDAEKAAKEGKRITSRDGDCYVCGMFVPRFGGELILWNEIPKLFFNDQLEGKYKKWRVRHISDQCSQDQYGKRIHLDHIRDHTGKRNERSDKCWLCGVEVAAGVGWLVNSEQIPKWKQTKKAFPRARAKKYYVQCSEDDA